MGKGKPQPPARECSTCGTSRTCLNCGGSGRWYTNPKMVCGHCSGSGVCPVNR